MAGDLILVGKVVATHGIKGQLRVVSFSGEFETFSSLSSVVLKAPSGGSETFPLSGAVNHGKKILISLKGFADINAVQRFVGCDLYVQRDQLPELLPGEYYWYQLEGLKVVTVSGEVLGTITSLIPTGSNDVYVVTSGNREYMIPAIEGIVVGIDLTEGAMTVDPPEGLLDL